MARSGTSFRTVVTQRTVERVTFVCPYALSVFGGVQEQVLAMSRELSRRGITVQIIAPDDSDQADYETPAQLARFGHLLSLPANGSRAPLTLSPRAARAAHDEVTNFAPDVVHFHEPFAPLVGWRTLRTHRAPSVGTFHRSGAKGPVKLLRPLLRVGTSHLDAYVAVSEMAAATARELYGVGPEVLFNGFENERFTSFPRGRLPELTLLIVGRLESRKGVATAISAVQAHNQRGAQTWRLVIIGEGPEHTTLSRRIGDDPAITLLGAVSDEEKRRWYRNADVLVAPATHGESFGLILLEAMASETRVVASDIPGYRDAAGSHAILFPPGQNDGLEHAIDAALATRDPATLALAREHAQRWSIRALMDEYLGVYATAREHFQMLG